MRKLSAVIITFNEEQNIRTCLESVVQVSDEVIVVDSFSTDRTEAICREFGVRFVKNGFENYIQQKNFANNLAVNEFVLSLDADEALSKELINSILKWKSSAGGDGWMINRRNNYCGKWIRHSGWYPDRKLRLWSRYKGKWGGPVPHERVIMDQDAVVEKLRGDILHWSYRSIAEHETRLEKYAQLAALSMRQRGMKYSPFKILYKPAFRFFSHYILKLGFLDGKEGLQISRLMAREVHRKYSLLR